MANLETRRKSSVATLAEKRTHVDTDADTWNVETHRGGTGAGGEGTLIINDYYARKWIVQSPPLNAKILTHKYS